MDSENKQIHSLEDLKPYPHWVCFDAKKQPYNPLSGRLAQVNNPDTWGTFQQAWQAKNRNPQKYQGVGFVLTPDLGITVIDLDKCRGDDGTISPFAQEILRRFDSYSEFSPSGRGIHIWIRGTLPATLSADASGDGEDRIEAYDHARYITVTGCTINQEDTNA